MAGQSGHGRRHRRRRTGAAIAAALTLLSAAPARADTCPAPPDPVVSLDYGSRYAEGDESRSEIDDAAKAEAESALQPLDDFIRDLSDMANRALTEPDLAPEMADCVVAQLAVWARAGALQDLASPTARLTIASRLAGLALTLRLVAAQASDADALADINAWLTDLAHAQMTFWEEDAPPGAKRGNLRAWAALGGAAIADLTGDTLLRSWAAWSTDYVLCTTAPDGSLPQEMSRGRLAYHYQLHAVAPLVVATRLLRDHALNPGARCDDALDRVVGFTLADLASGEMTREITGETQSYFDGSREITGYHLAWLPAYMTMVPSLELEGLAVLYTPLSSSKLGGDQTLIWPLGAP